MKVSYAELNTKSCFSFLGGASHPEELIQTAHHLGYKAMALTDVNGFCGMVRAYEKARELSFSFIVGTEISLEKASLILLAKNKMAYQRICRLLSEGFLLSQKKSEPLINRELFQTWISSDIEVLLLPRDFPEISLLQWMREQTSLTQLVTLKQHPDLDFKMKDWLRDLPKDIPRAWTWDAFYHTPERHEIFEVLKAIRANCPLSQSLPSPNAEHYLKPVSALSEFKVPKAWISQTLEIAERCLFSPKEIRYQYPQEWLPPHKTSFQFLSELCEKGFEIRYAGHPPPNVRAQLAHEMELVQELHFEDYFLTVWDIVQFARAKKILCQGRGSAANSLICYLLEITSIDPVRMNLLFERFISRDRNEAPDIDIDFEHERREEVIQYVYEKYGRHRAGMVATLITYRTKSALRDVGKALEIPFSTIEEWSKKSRWRENVFQEDSSLNDPKLKRWLRLARTLKGFPRHLGQHTGGMILTQDRLDEISPITPATMPGRTVVQWDKYDVEKLGLLKIDLLSLGMLTCIRKTFDLIAQSTGKNLELYTIPANDSKTFEMIGEARTVGVFQIESRAQMTMLPRLKPRNFYDLVIEVAIVRPGPLQGGMVHPFLRRRMGLETIDYAHPKLRPILEKTLGVPIFQEQVMKMAIEVAGYTPGEADTLRRAMGAWKKSGNLEIHAAKMRERLIKNGVPEAFSGRVCEQILGFGEYGFPESHAASFALLTYASSYLKAHYPTAFLCGLLNSMPMGFYPLHILTSVFQREGVKIEPVHTEYSEWDHRLENQGIRLGFRCVKRMQKAHVEEFIRERQKGNLDLFIFNQEERAALAMATEFENRRKAYWNALDPHKDLLPLKSSHASISFPDLNALQSMFLDFEFFETTLSTHPTLLLKNQNWEYAFSREKVLLSDQLSSLKNGARVYVFGVTQIVQSPPTAHGMFFITLEDETGFLNLVLKPYVYEKFKNLIQNHWALMAGGRLQNNDGYSSIMVDMIYPKLPKAALVKKLSPHEDSAFVPLRLFH